MALVKLINLGPENFTKIHNGVKYSLDADPSGATFLIVDEGVAKHWLGDWTIDEVIAANAEKKRLLLLNGTQPQNYKIKVERLKEMVVTDRDTTDEDVPVINEAVEAPEEKEFEALDEIVAKKAKPKKI